MEESKKWDIERIAGKRLLSVGVSPVSVGCGKEKQNELNKSVTLCK